MAMSLNKVVLIGNLGKDPEIKVTQDGRELASFSVATTESWSDKSSGERREKTEWHRVVVFVPPLVKIVKSYIHKGSKVYLEGSLQTRKWADQTGAERTAVEVVLQAYNSTLILLDNKHGAGGVPHSSIEDMHKPEHMHADIADHHDDIPF